MAKSIKYKDNTYLDSRGIVHNEKTLNKMIDDLSGDTFGGLARKRRMNGISFNDLVNQGSGLFVMYGPCTNAPDKNGDGEMHWYCTQIVYNTNYCVQIAMALHTNLKHIYMRHKINSTWNEWLSISNESGMYRLSDNLNVSGVGTEITLSSSVVNYDYLIIATGAISGENYLNHQIIPYTSNFPLNTKGRGKWGAWSGMIPVVKTFSGKIVFTFENETKMKIKSFSGTENVRGVFGVKLY